MKQVLFLSLLLSVAGSSHAASPFDRLRTAQSRPQPVAECVERCNSSNFTCARNCGLSGACVAQCTVEADACKKECQERR
jgi:hypothetical protein